MISPTLVRTSGCIILLKDCNVYHSFPTGWSITLLCWSTLLYGCGSSLIQYLCANFLSLSSLLRTTPLILWSTLPFFNSSIFCLLNSSAFLTLSRYFDSLTPSPAQLSHPLLTASILTLSPSSALTSFSFSFSNYWITWLSSSVTNSCLIRPPLSLPSCWSLSVLISFFCLVLKPVRSFRSAA